MFSFPAPFIVVQEGDGSLGSPCVFLIISLDTSRVLCRCGDVNVASTVAANLNDLQNTRPAIVALMEGRV